MNERESALDLFRNACGLSVPLALECKAANGSSVASATHVFEFPFVLIGRDRKSDLLLDNAQISRRHAFLQALDGRVLVVDLESRTGVTWEGEDAPRSRGWLEEDRFIQVGPYRIRRVCRSASEYQQSQLFAPSSPSQPAENGVGSIPRAALELPIRIGTLPSLWSLDEQVVLVGRSEHCDLVLTDGSVSLFHAAFVSTTSGLWVVDLLAREGVHVNGERVRWAWLAQDDSIRLGSFTFRLHYETPPDRISRSDVPLVAGAGVALEPGTALAVRIAPQSDPQALALRPRARSPVRIKTTGLSQSLERSPLIASSWAPWEPSVPFDSNRTAMWQQQMQLMESFHHDMTLMVQMFAAMHREHLASVRHELDMYQQLTGELRELQAKLARGSATPGARATRRTGRPSQEHPSDRRLNLEERDHKSVSPDPSNASSRPGPASPGPEENSSRRPSGPRSALGQMPAASAGSGDGEASQIHAVLSERIAELQRERQGYWQRILSALHG
jgi:pSer/pThr/pTyr-binding forkhead associated (FHA) protein